MSPKHAAIKLERLLQNFLQHTKHNQNHYTLAGLAIFTLGLWASLVSLKLDPTTIAIDLLLVNAILGAPTALALNALGLKTSASAAGTNITFADALRVTATATASNVLPIPAGAIYHTGAIASRGVSIAVAGGFIAIGSLLYLTLIATLIGMVIIKSNFALGVGLLITGSIASVCLIALIAVKSTCRIATLFLLIRILRLGVMVLRVWLCFSIIDVSADITQAGVVAASVSIGTLVAVMPAGLGIAETVAAALSITVGLPAAAGFTAVAINRVMTILVALGMALIFYLQAFIRGNYNAN
ncbi:hypothetical protein [Wenzhouxiangella limi]|uniref:Uncharacterized protein n=1 Tax=Wenzhouxiangella limi TaxID=2707351 RepID=A0A845UWZ8_9GAMM|nr:hypothetical protein [Wenzhouxiangella limi]NDY95024.1 hypothetical protein [Wenzhouxiangella limi]